MTTFGIRQGLVLLATAMALVAFWNVGSASANIVIGPSNGVLKVTGDDAINAIVLRLKAGDPSQLEFDVDNNSVFDGSVPLGSFSKIEANMGGGSDLLWIKETNGTFTDKKPTTINGDGGDDDLIGGLGAEQINGDGDDDTITGNGGDDTITGSSGNDVFVRLAGDGKDTVAGGEDLDIATAFGTRFEDHLSIVPSGADVELVSEATPILDLSSVEELRVKTGQGSDLISAHPLLAGDTRLVIDSGTPLAGVSGADGEDVVTGSEFSDVIIGGPGKDQLVGRGGDDEMFGKNGDDTLIGGAGADKLTGAAGADSFECDAAGEALDLEPLDLTFGPCVAPEEPPVEPTPAPAPQPAPAPAPGPTSTPTSTQAGTAGFAKPIVRATRRGLRVTLRSTSPTRLSLRIAARERFHSRRAARYRVVRTSIAPGGRVVLRLRAPRALRARIARQLALRGRAVRRPTVTVTNVPTAATTAVHPRLVLRAG
jgi:hypothetical protein